MLGHTMSLMTVFGSASSFKTLSLLSPKSTVHGKVKNCTSQFTLKVFKYSFVGSFLVAGSINSTPTKSNPQETAVCELCFQSGDFMLFIITFLISIIEITSKWYNSSFLEIFYLLTQLAYYNYIVLLDLLSCCVQPCLFDEHWNSTLKFNLFYMLLSFLPTKNISLLHYFISKRLACHAKSQRCWSLLTSPKFNCITLLQWRFHFDNCSQRRYLVTCHSKHITSYTLYLDFFY